MTTQKGVRAAVRRIVDDAHRRFTCMKPDYDSVLLGERLVGDILRDARNETVRRCVHAVCGGCRVGVPVHAATTAKGVTVWVHYHHPTGNPRDAALARPCPASALHGLRAEEVHE